MKTLNIELNVRRMEAQNILTASNLPVSQEPVSNTDIGAPARTSAAGSIPLRAGF